MNRRSFFSRAAAFLAAPFVAKIASAKEPRGLTHFDDLAHAATIKLSHAPRSSGKLFLAMRDIVRQVLVEQKTAAYASPKGIVTITPMARMGGHIKVVFSCMRSHGHESMRYAEFSGVSVLLVRERFDHEIARLAGIFRDNVDAVLGLIERENIRSSHLDDPDWSVADHHPMTREGWNELMGFSPELQRYKYPT